MTEVFLAAIMTELMSVVDCRDLRLRQYLGQRYDSIPNVFDWDYSMKLCDKGVSCIVYHLLHKCISVLQTRVTYMHPE